MNKTLRMTGKAIGTTLIIGFLVLTACLFSESSRSYYPAEKAR